MKDKAGMQPVEWAEAGSWQLIQASGRSLCIVSADMLYLVVSLMLQASDQSTLSHHPFHSIGQ